MKANLTEAEIAYAAGVFDGEGCVHIGKKPMVVIVNISQTDVRLLWWFRERFDGVVSSHSTGKAINNKPTWRWVRNASGAHEFLTLIRPYLIVKAAQADIAILFRETVAKSRGRYYPLTKTVVDRRLDLRSQMQTLNKRGIA